MPVGWQWLNRLRGRRAHAEIALPPHACAPHPTPHTCLPCRISPSNYILEGLACSQLCDRDDLTLVLPGGSETTVSAFLSSYFGYHSSFLWFTPLIITGYCMAFLLASGLVVRFISFQRR